MAVKQCHKKEKKMSERKLMKMAMMWSDLLRRNLKRCDTKKIWNVDYIVVFHIISEVFRLLLFLFFFSFSLKERTVGVGWGE